MHICLPDFVDTLQAALGGTASAEGTGSEAAPSGCPWPSCAARQARVPRPGSLRVHTVSRLLLKFANFVKSAEGSDTTTLVSQGLRLAPSDSECLASFAHFLAQEGDRQSYQKLCSCSQGAQALAG